MKQVGYLEVSNSGSIMSHSLQEGSSPSPLQQSLNEATEKSYENDPQTDLDSYLTLKRLTVNDAITELKQLHEIDSKNKEENPFTSFEYKKKYNPRILSKTVKQSILIKPSPPHLSIHSTVQDIQNFVKLSKTPENIFGISLDEKVGFSDHSTEKDTILELPATLEILVSSLPISKEKKVLNPFFLLCEDVLNSLVEFESYMQSFSSWKDDFLKQNVTSTMKLSLALLVAKLFRSHSDLTQMVLEIVRCVKTYSKPWTKKLNAIMSLEEEHVRQKKAFEVALRKIEALHAQLERIRASKQVFLWEYITKKLLWRQQSTETQDNAFSFDTDSDTDSETDSNSGTESISKSSDKVSENLENEPTDVKNVLHTEREGKSYCSVQTQTDPFKGDLDNQIPQTSTTLSPKNVLKATKKQRLSDIKEFLEFKKKSKLNNENPTSISDLSLFSKEEISEQNFNALLNRRFPHLPRTVYQYLASSKHHPNLLYPSEVVQFQASFSTSLDETLPTIKAAWTTDDVPELLSPPVLKSLMRCNSTNALPQLEAVMKTSLNFAAEAEKAKKALENFAKSIDKKSMPQQLHFDQLITEKQVDDPKNPLKVDVSKAWFSFQDVLELSILHMQQVKQLRDEYENKLLQLRNLQISYSIKPTLPEIKSSSTSLHSKRVPSTSNRQKTLSPVKSERPAKIEKENKVDKLVSRPHHPSPLRPVIPRHYKRSLHLHPVPQYVPKHSSFLNLNFLQRMAWMASKSRDKKHDTSEKVLREQFETNLSKIIVDKKQLFSRAQVTRIMESILPAVFMPFPEKTAENSKFPTRPFSRALEKRNGKSSPKSHYFESYLTVYPDPRESPPSKHSI